MNSYFDEINKELLTEVECILNDFGLEVSDVLNILFKRIRKEGNVNFLMSKSASSTATSANIQTSPIAPAVQKDSTSATATMDTQLKMTKSKAAALLRQKGYSLNGTTTFSSKNQAAYHYWANPSFDVLNEQWNLILNDWINRELHLFIIPAHTIAAQSLVCRADKPYQIDLQIMYGDSSFTDMRSKMSFAQFLTQSLKY